MKATRKSQQGFTLIELLLAVSLLAVLTTLMYGVFSNSRRTAQASQLIADRIRIETLLRELIQSEFDLSATPLTVEFSGTVARGFSFTTTGVLSGRTLKIRVRYVFEPDSKIDAYRLMRYVIAEGIGVDENKEMILDLVRDPVITAYSESAEGFVRMDEMLDVPRLIRVEFKHLRQISPAVSDDIRVILNHA